MPRATAPSGRSSRGRTRLLDAAEQLLVESGIDGTTGAAILERSGSRNAAAVNYHFGNLDSLIHAVLERRAVALDERRNVLLDQLDAAGITDPRAVCSAMAAPLAELLDRPEGRRSLRLLNQAANHPRFRRDVNWESATSMRRGVALIVPLVAHLSPQQQRHRVRNVVGLVLYSFAEEAREIDEAGGATMSSEEFTADLVASAVAALRAEA